jgi:uncharacterized protein YdeI (YjbR/CyaY-like superfamily)
MSPNRRPSVEPTGTRKKSRAEAGSTTSPAAGDPLVALTFDGADEWEAWLAEHHGDSAGVWLRFRRRAAVEGSLTYGQALDVALCYGWIDGQNKREDERMWRQKFTPRRAQSIWSKVNREKASALIAAGRMKPAGLAQVERAKQDGRWAAAYDPGSRASVPPDLLEALEAAPQAKRFFETLDSRNRYAILFRTETAKKAETRVKRIAQFVDMLKKGEKIYP